QDDPKRPDEGVKYLPTFISSKIRTLIVNSHQPMSILTLLVSVFLFDTWKFVWYPLMIVSIVASLLFVGFRIYTFVRIVYKINETIKVNSSKLNKFIGQTNQHISTL